MTRLRRPPRGRRRHDPKLPPSSLDHVALWVDNRGPLATFLCQHLGMHVIEETDSFTLVGVDAKLGKLTLFDAEGPRERGARADRAARGRPRRRAGGTAVDPTAQDDGWPSSRPRRVAARAGRGRGRGLRPRPRGLPVDLEAAMAELARLGFERRDGVVAVADRHVRIEARLGRPGGARSSTTWRCSSTTPIGSRARQSPAGSRSTTSRTPRTPSPCSCAAPRACGSSTWSTSRASRSSERRGPVGRRGRHGRARRGRRGAPARRRAGRAREAPSGPADRCGCRAA